MVRLIRSTFVFATAVVLSASAAMAVTLTFDGVPNGGIGCDASGNPDSVLEGGFTISNCPGWHVESGQIHLDDGGSSFPNRVDFSTSGLFEAESVTLIGRGFAFVDFDLHESVPYDNVLFEGFRDGDRVASQGFSTFGLTDVPTTVLFAPEFAILDLLQISQVFPGPDDYARFPNAECEDVPCGHIDLDKIVLSAPVPVPLPAGFGSLLIAIALTAAVGHRRRRGAGLPAA